MATIRVEFDTQGLTDREAEQFAAAVVLGGADFAFNLLWRNRVAVASHMTAADWTALKGIAYRLGIDFPC